MIKDYKNNHECNCKNKKENHIHDNNINKNVKSESNINKCCSTKKCCSSNVDNDNSTSEEDDDGVSLVLKDNQNHHHKHKHNHHKHKHNHHSHNECYHYDFYDKNLFLRFIKKILLSLGLIMNHDHEVVEEGSYDPHAGHDHGGFEVKKWILIIGIIFTILSLVTMIIGAFVGGVSKILILGNKWFEFSIATIMFIIMGIAFIKGSTNSLLKKTIAEDTLVAIATTSAYLISILSLAMNWNFSLFYEAIEVWGLIYLGRFLENWLSSKVSSNIASLESLKPKKALVIRNGKELEIDTKDLKIGETLIIKPGEVIPVDGIIIEGITIIDESSLTGESIPITKEKGSSVFGGTISSNGLIKVKAKKLIGDSFISKIIKSVVEATEAKPASQRVADKIAGFLVPSVLGIAIIVFIAWITIGYTIGIPEWMISLYKNDLSPITYALFSTMTVLIMACPCSFALMTPMSILTSSATSKKEGVIFSSKNIFELAQKVNVVAFDKTGTLTKGKFKLINSTVDKDLIPYVIAGEMNSNHPIAKSIINHYKDIPALRIESSEIIGKGIQVGKIFIGSKKLVKEIIPKFNESKEIINKRKEGSIFIYVIKDKKINGYFELKDEIKEDAIMTLSILRKMNIDVVMITGDQKDTAISIASKLGIRKEKVYYEVEPKDKANVIKKIQNNGNKKVSFIGDGINDSVALIQSNLGIAIGEGSDAAIEASDIVLNKNDLTLVPYALGLSKRTLKTIKRGFTIAIVYNVASIPMAATGFIPPALGALLMILNDSMAMLNAMTIFRYTNKKFNKKISKMIN